MSDAWGRPDEQDLEEHRAAVAEDIERQRQEDEQFERDTAWWWDE